MTRKKTTEVEETQSGRLGDFGSAISALCEEKGISKEKVVETIEAALAAAYKKDYGKKGQNIKAIFNEKTGDTKYFLVKEVVDETVREFVEEKEEGMSEEVKRVKEEKVEDGVEKLPRYNPERDLTVEQAKEIKKDAAVNDVIEIELEQKKDYGRVAAQTAKQVIIQRIREAERDSMFEEYKNREGEIIAGVVQRVEGRNIFIDLGKSVGVLFPSEQVPGESYRIGQRLKVYLAKVEAGSKGPGITLSRVHAEMIKKLFELEVPEIFAGTVGIKSIAREAGERTKLAVFSDEDGIDPIGSCVGQKGTRVQAVIDELGGEKIDIILWNEDIAKFIAAALSPAKVLKVEAKEDLQEATVSVPEDQLSLAIGKKGQNVRLAAKLTGWKIDIVGVAAKKEVPEDVEGEVPTEEVEVVEEEVSNEE
ncbi:MAG: transcription termination/antitermination protein NusA [Candidatus Moranbacteria bacterium CG23_combo_of_CG06-09_8_20_14_all_39_10]|nr:MAG: transcription termination/antitermination protein NusA [Candidatus Moranbacteria bacterium CG23_combo_of_CG06-09_8_20_14_all_39_10]